MLPQRWSSLPHRVQICLQGLVGAYVEYATAGCNRRLSFIKAQNEPRQKVRPSCIVKGAWPDSDGTVTNLTWLGLGRGLGLPVARARGRQGPCSRFHWTPSESNFKLTQPNLNLKPAIPALNFKFKFPPSGRSPVTPGRPRVAAAGASKMQAAAGMMAVAGARRKCT